MSLIHKIKALRHKAYLAYCSRLPIQQNKIILWSDNFKTFGCSPKYIALYLAEHYPEKYDIVWVLERERPVPADCPAGIRIVRYFSMEYLKEIATAKVIVCNHRTSDYHFFRKRKGQFYIQTWHGGLALKMIEADAPGLPKHYVKVAKGDSQKIDLLLSGWEANSQIFKRAFWYDGEILNAGTPRCDSFFRDAAAIKEKVYRFYDIPAEKKLALYAPTFRKDKSASIYGLDFAMLKKALGDDWVAGCRLHPNIDTPPQADGCIQMSKYPDMQELLIACDLLITDYSSSMFDMAVAGKRCALYMPDLENYMQNERGLYFDIDALPFPKAEDMNGLCQAISDFSDYEEKRKTFLKEAGSYEDGNAAKAVAQRIREVCG